MDTIRKLKRNLSNGSDTKRSTILPNSTLGDSVRKVVNSAQAQGDSKRIVAALGIIQNDLKRQLLVNMGLTAKGLRKVTLVYQVLLDVLRNITDIRYLKTKGFNVKELELQFSNKEIPLNLMSIEQKEKYSWKEA
jgi:hypothetical protein